MRFLAAMEIFYFAGAGKYTTTPFASAYVTASPLAQGAIHMFVLPLPPLSQLTFHSS